MFYKLIDPILGQFLWYRNRRGGYWTETSKGWFTQGTHCTKCNRVVNKPIKSSYYGSWTLYCICGHVATYRWYAVDGPLEKVIKHAIRTVRT